MPPTSEKTGPARTATATPDATKGGASPSLTNEDRVRDFFHNTAHAYTKRLSFDNPFYRYHNLERLDEATRSLNLNGKRILDIGAGTGLLYDYLSTRYARFDYYACDIAPAMLELSKIPPERRFACRAYDAPYPVREFDHIFMLGVTTYVEPPELSRIFGFIQDHLTRGGTASITFTNSRSISNRINARIARPASLLNLKNAIVGQGFTIHSYTVEEAQHLFSRSMAVERVSYLNHTLYPLNLIARSPSVRIAEQIHNRLHWKRALEPLSADFLIVFRKRGGRR